MTSIFTYVSGHTELGDVTEFFQKKLLNPGERPIAFFDGVFYESHQERVGNIAFQDYLIYSDKAVYLWARGANKDYLDRFTLGAVSINCRNKDNDFATLNLRIRREGKEPVYVIFDMVERAESEKIIALHTIIESTIESSLGNNFREELPDEIAEKILTSAVNICPPAPLAFSPPADQVQGSEKNSQIGYGQDLLEQYKASIGYTPEGRTAPSAEGMPSAGRPSGGSRGSMPPGIPKELEGMLPTDPEALKRIAGNLKETIGEAPFKLRDQVMKDLQHVPNDVATMLSAINELISNIADNPKAEKFVMNAIQTAVKNDGILGSVGKMLKMTTSFGPMGKKGSAQHSSGHSASGTARSEEPGEGLPVPDETSEPIRRKKVKIQADSEMAGDSNASLDQVLHDMETGLPSDFSDSSENKPGESIQRKKVTVATNEQEATVDTDASHKAGAPSTDGQGEKTVRSRKIKVKTEERDVSPSVEEQLKEALKTVGELGDVPASGILDVGEEADAKRRKISVQSESVTDNECEKSQSKVYRTMESEHDKDCTEPDALCATQKKPTANSKSQGPLNKSK
ncbi:hypothetical protein [Prosthecochloris sp.]|uniref:hypothetical protein n=1 Tax=Prosthecochloris sp. TaxID=290513 RepID=UPI00257D1BC3|nr:hypothetical protein [Prosthecochloris sp.]